MCVCACVCTVCVCVCVCVCDWYVLDMCAFAFSNARVRPLVCMLAFAPVYVYARELHVLMCVTVI